MNGYAVASKITGWAVVLLIVFYFARGMADASQQEAMGVVYMAFVIFLYFGPSLVAMRRSHHNASAIFALNLLLGWTVLGWIGALVWALTEPRRLPGT